MKCKTCSGSGSISTDRKLVVNIPVGIETGQKIKLAGEGTPGENGGRPGDLLIEVTVLPDPEFKREGNNLIIERTITLKEAIFGTKTIRICYVYFKFINSIFFSNTNSIIHIIC